MLSHFDEWFQVLWCNIATFFLVAGSLGLPDQASAQTTICPRKPLKDLCLAVKRAANGALQHRGRKSQQLCQ